MRKLINVCAVLGWGYTAFQVLPLLWEHGVFITAATGLAYMITIGFILI